MVSTREKILAFLERRGTASAIELSKALKLTSANIRHHLRILQKEGVIVPLRVGQTSGRGRPAYLYALRDQQKAHNLERLCSALLHYLRSAASSHERDIHLRSIAQELVAEKATSTTMSITQRLIITTNILNEMSYKASWEAHREAPTIKFSHCPYASIVNSFPELCQIDRYLLETLMHLPIETLTTRETLPTGETICRFRLRQSRL
ncbi:MAG: Iron-sulfur cluster regulator SufR [Anaerolineae bacterium]|jgi:predicted ArsR family transcriptional regulator|nr:MAG: Iron-sulfur cluster regulator SufR [Anaerolineae bacterium]